MSHLGKQATYEPAADQAPPASVFSALAVAHGLRPRLITYVHAFYHNLFAWTLTYWTTALESCALNTVKIYLGAPLESKLYGSCGHGSVMGPSSCLQSKRIIAGHVCLRGGQCWSKGHIHDE